MEKYILSKPVQNGADEIKELNFPEELQAKHMRYVPISGNFKYFGEMYDLIASLTRQPKSVIDNLSAMDIFQVSKKVSTYLERELSQAIGSG